MLNEIYEELKEQMEKALDFYKNDLITIRTGRASRALVDKIKVDYYGAPTPLIQLASIAIPEPRTLTINPFDKTTVPLIDKTLISSDIGITPLSDGKIIRLNFPPLTQDRRKQLVKVVKKKAEDCKVALRNIRRDYNETVKDLKKEGDIPEDDQVKALKKIQDITDGFSKIVDDVTTAKDREIMED